MSLIKKYVKIKVFVTLQCLLKFCEYLRELAMKIIKIKKKKMIFLTKEQQESYMKMQKSVIFVEEKLKINM